jgi:3-hydroxyisobutyrate dehydrogenase-like beta-hydroxyacid dehydrogenase
VHVTSVGFAVGFLGIGKMGLPMARHLIEAGHTVRVYNRTAERAAPLVALGATACSTPAEAARGSSVVVTMLADDAAVLETSLGPDGIVDGLAADGIHIAMSTQSPGISRRLAAAGGRYVAAPVFGRPDVAEAGQLFIAAAGPRDAEEACKPLFEAMGRGYIWLGEDQATANITKIAMNFLLVSMVESQAEALSAVEKAGGDPAAFFELAKTIYPSPGFAGYGGRMVERQFVPAGFSTVTALKDAGLMLQLAMDSGAPSPLASVNHDRLLQATSRGRGEWDLAALLVVARESAGLE